jgi:putative ABC transport system permease protein
VWADRDAIARAVGRDSLISSVRVRLHDASAVGAFAAGIADDPTLGLAAESEPRYDERQREGMARFVLGIGLLLCVCFALGGTIGAAVTMHASVAHRRREIGTLRALGFRRRQVLVAFLLEALLLASAGGALGVGGALALGQLRFSLVNVANWSEVVFRFEPTPGVLAASVAFAGALGLVGGLLPAIRAASVPPIRAIRS